MKVKAKAATSYHWRGLRYVWEDGETAIDVPDSLGAYLVTKRGEFWTEVEVEVEAATTEPPSRAAAPEIGIAKTAPDSPLTPEAHAGAVGRFEGANDGDAENAS